ncbi:MAG TPA: universal stress protein [Chloroflexota bacterium]|nr:universal stress protein [Chloroflexota bacterium]
MYRTIFVPLDGSDLAERALPYAARLASLGVARLVLARVIREPDAAAPESFQEDVRARREAKDYLDAVVERHLSLPGLRPPETFVVSGEPAPALLELAQRERASLIVMGTHGRSGIGRWLYGSVAERVLHEAHVPVFLVPTTAPAGWPADRPPRVLVPLDGSAFATEAIAAAAPLIEGLRADVVLVRVVEPAIYVASPYGPMYAAPAVGTPEALAAAEDYVESVAAPLRRKGYTASAVVREGYPANELARVASDGLIDVIAMATHGRTGLARLVLGSVATATLRHANVPLLLVRPEALRTPGGGHQEEHAEAPAGSPAGAPKPVGAAA